MSLGGVLVLTSSNKDKQSGITVVVHERREETREKRRDSWKRSSRVFKSVYSEAVEEYFGGDSFVDVQITIVEIKFQYKTNLSFEFHCLLFLFACRAKQSNFKTNNQTADYQTSQQVFMMHTFLIS